MTANFIFLCVICMYKMKKITPASGTKSIKIIPRDYTGTLSMVLRDRSKNKATNVTSTTVTEDGNHTQIDWEYSGTYLIENHQYDLSVIDEGDNVVYRDSMLVTSQTIDQTTDDTYSINKDVYTTYASGGDDYIVLED